MDIEETKYFFSRMSDIRLINLLPEIIDMQKEELMILREELKKRSLKEEVEIVDSHLNFIQEQEESEQPETQSSSGTISKSKEKKVNVPLSALLDQNEEDAIQDYIKYLKEKGMSDSYINERLKEGFNLDHDEGHLLINELHKKGEKNIRLGYILIILSLVFGIISFSILQMISLPFVLIFIAGILRIQHGKKQLG